MFTNEDIFIRVFVRKRLFAGKLMLRQVTDVGSKIKSRRKSLGLTQAELAKKCNVSRSWLAQLEAGKASVELGLVFKVAERLDLVFDLYPKPQTNTVNLDAIVQAGIENV